MVSNNFINECKNGAYNNRLGKINVETLNTTTGNPVNIEKAKQIDTLRLNGYTRQKTYTGKNLLPNSATTTTLNGLTFTINKDGSIHITGTSTSRTLLNINANDTITLKENVSYTLSKQGDNQYVDVNLRKKVVNELIASILKTNTTKTFINTYTEPVFVYIGIDSNITLDVTISLQIEEGTQATDYEPYVGGQPSPSPDYPQEIEVGKGKNILDFDSLLKQWNATYTEENGIYNITAFEKSPYQNPITLDLKPNTTYTISNKLQEQNSEKLRIDIIDETNTLVAYIFANGNSKQSQTFTTNDTSTYKLRLNWSNYTYPMIYNQPQLEKGPAATEYGPYNTVIVKSTGKNLLENKTKNRGTVKGIDFALNEDGTYTINGKNDGTGNSALFLTSASNPLTLEAGTYYMPATPSGSTISAQYREDGAIKYLTLITSTKTSFTINETLNLEIYLQVINGSTITFNNVKIYPMISKTPIAKEDYEPYKESSIQYYLGDNFLADKDYIENGVLNKNIGKVVLNGSEGWETSNQYNNLFQLVSSQWNYKSQEAVCSHFKVIVDQRIIANSPASNYLNDNEVAFRAGQNMDRLYLKSTKFTTVDELKSWLSENPVTVYYELAEPKQIQLETTGELKTFEPTTIISNSLDNEMEVEFTDYSTEITHADNLSSFTIEDGCYVDGNIIGTTYLKKLTAQFVSIPQNVDLIDKTIYAKIGVKYADLSEEWLEMGKYTIERPKDEQTADLTQITTYDDFNKLDKPYICNLNFENDVTVGDYYADVCNQLELTPKKTTFINSDIPVSANPFVNNETLRFVLQEIEKVACSFSEIDFSTNEIDLVWLSQNEEPDYEFETSDYSTLEGGKIVYGPVNSLVLKYSQIEGENATIEDEESIATNGETQLAIEDSYFLFTEDLKWQAINKIWERVKGLTYTDCKLTSYYGKPFLKVGQKIRVHTNDGRVFDTYVLKHTFTYDGTFQSIIESPVLTKQETKIKNKSISEAIRITEIKVDKANGQITATTKKTQELEDNLNNNYYSKTNVNELIQTAETGVTNTFSEAGGNNIFRNTGLWFDNDGDDKEINPYEFWIGNVKKESNENAANNTSMLLQNGALSQEQEVPNGNYSISFFYRKLSGLANASVVINDKEYPLDSSEVKQFFTGEQDSETGEYITQPIVVTSNHIKIEFKCDVPNGVEVWDLMCNKGTVKLAWSQNQNETTTETVNISKGITITSTNIEAIFKANANGIKILTLQGATVAYFTDKGLSTKELIVENKAQICGTLVQEVGGQTWFTRM